MTTFVERINDWFCMGRSYCWRVGDVDFPRRPQLATSQSLWTILTCLRRKILILSRREVRVQYLAELVPYRTTHNHWWDRHRHLECIQSDLGHKPRWSRNLLHSLDWPKFDTRERLLCFSYFLGGCLVSFRSHVTSYWIHMFLSNFCFQRRSTLIMLAWQPQRSLEGSHRPRFHALK